MNPVQELEHIHLMNRKDYNHIELPHYEIMIKKFKTINDDYLFAKSNYDMYEKYINLYKYPYFNDIYKKSEYKENNEYMYNKKIKLHDSRIQLNDDKKMEDEYKPPSIGTIPELNNLPSIFNMDDYIPNQLLNRSLDDDISNDYDLPTLLNFQDYIKNDILYQENEDDIPVEYIRKKRGRKSKSH